MPYGWLRIPPEDTAGQYRQYNYGVIPSTIYNERSANTTLNAADSGVIQYITASNLTITLPSGNAATAGMVLTIVNTIPNNVGNLSVAPAANQMIIGAGQAGANNNAWTLAKANAYPGDMIQVTGIGTVGWYVSHMSGKWAYA